MRPIYLDYAATTPCDPQVIEKMNECLGFADDFGNPASNTHMFGFFAKERVDLARMQVARLLNADVKEIVFTSGATEANNMAILGAVAQHKIKHVITMATEHKAVLDPCAQLAREEVAVTYLKPQSDGLLDLAELAAAITPETGLVSIMMVNNETGVIQDLASIAALVKANDIFLHVDAVQAAGKLPIDVKKLPVDLLSVSAHKIYGPKGIGALYIRRQPRMRIKPLIYGGGHENGFRSGTLATHQIVGMGEAFSIANAHLAEESKRIQALKDKLWAGISSLPGVHVNGDIEHSVCAILNVRFEGVDGESLIMALDKLAVSSGSACTSATIETSHVLAAMGLSDADAHSSLRLSIGRFTTDEDIDLAITEIKTHVTRLRELAPELS